MLELVLSHLGSEGIGDKDLDSIYDLIDDMLIAGFFAELDGALRVIPVGQLPSDLLLGILVATLPARDCLVNRACFFEAVQGVLVGRPGYNSGLLDGLA